MPARPSPVRRPLDPVAQARAAARRAYGHAREAGGLATGRYGGLIQAAGQSVIAL
jgi:hypothetical protein